MSQAMSTSRIGPIEQAIDRASLFLRSSLREGRYCLDCFGEDGSQRFSHNKGHLFVAYFLADAMTDRLDEIDRTILLTRILSEERSGHWGFSPGDLYFAEEQGSFIVDADDTAYVLRTLRGLGAYRMPDSLLSYQRDPTGGFVTFEAKGSFVNDVRVAVEPSFANNLAIHPEVTLNVYSMLRGTNLERHIYWPIIEGFQHPDGWWYSYFYPGEYFGTVLAVEFLKSDEHYRPHLQRTKEFLHQSQNGDGSWGTNGDPYATGLALRGLAALESGSDSIERGVKFLLNLQQDAGGWESNAIIWRFVGASNEEWLATDRHGTLVTSIVSTALRRCLVPA
jgi:squalene cyclase